MIIAVGGSRWSSLASTRNSRERWTDLARDSLPLVAAEVDSPQAVLAEIPAVTDSVALVPLEVPDSPPRDMLELANGTKLLSLERPRLVPRDVESLADSDVPSDTLSPTVLVYETPAVSVTEVPTVS